MSERLPEEPGANPALLNLAGLDLSAGQRLAQARERAGLSHEQVADKLKLDAYTIVALENSDYRVIGAAVFVRGFLRRYAQLVGESPSEIEALYSRQPESALAQCVLPYMRSAVIDQARALVSGRWQWR
jgi:cytoskeletal protein RodZ